MEHSGNTLGATGVRAMWSDAIANAQAIPIDAASPSKTVTPSPSNSGPGSDHLGLILRGELPSFSSSHGTPSSSYQRCPQNRGSSRSGPAGQKS